MNDAGNSDRVDGRLSLGPSVFVLVPVFNLIRRVLAGHRCDGLVGCLVHEVPELAILMNQSILQSDIACGILALVKFEVRVLVVLGEFTQGRAD